MVLLAGPSVSSFQGTGRSAGSLLSKLIWVPTRRALSLQPKRRGIFSAFSAGSNPHTVKRREYGWVLPQSAQPCRVVIRSIEVMGGFVKLVLTIVRGGGGLAQKTGDFMFAHWPKSPCGVEGLLQNG